MSAPRAASSINVGYARRALLFLRKEGAWPLEEALVAAGVLTRDEVDAARAQSRQTDVDAGVEANAVAGATG
jgi:hypothetical protein